MRDTAAVSLRYSFPRVEPRLCEALALTSPAAVYGDSARVPGGCDCFDAGVVYHRCPQHLHQSLADRLVGAQSG